MIINTAQGGGGVKLNVYCQPDLPTNKFDGILLQASEKEALKKVIFDDDVWAAGTWQNPSQVADMPDARSGAYCGLINGEIYIFGGYINGSSTNTAIKYDTTTNTYISLASLPDTEPMPCGAVVNGYIYIFGAREIYRYNTQTDTYSIMKDTSYRFASCCAAIDSKIYVFGGDLSGSSVTKTAYCYDTVSNAITNLIDMPVAIDYPCCCTVNHKIYIFYQSNAFVYDSDTKSYSEISTPPSSVYKTCCVNAGESIYIFLMDKLMKYIISTNTYTDITTMPQNMLKSFCALMGNKIYVFGGDGNPTPTYSSVKVFLLTSKQYSYSPAIIVDDSQQMYRAIILKSSLSDVRTKFADAMIYKEGNITFPSLYIGDGTRWTKIREAQ